MCPATFALSPTLLSMPHASTGLPFRQHVLRRAETLGDHRPVSTFSLTHPHKRPIVKQTQGRFQNQQAGGPQAWQVCQQVEPFRRHHTLLLYSSSLRIHLHFFRALHGNPPRWFPSLRPVILNSSCRHSLSNPKEAIVRTMQPFRRSCDALKRRRGGLGLSSERSCHRLVPRLYDCVSELLAGVSSSSAYGLSSLYNLNLKGGEE